MREPRGERALDYWSWLCFAAWCELGSASGKLILDLCDAPEPEGDDQARLDGRRSQAQTGQGVLNASYPIPQRGHSGRCQMVREENQRVLFQHRWASRQTILENIW